MPGPALGVVKILDSSINEHIRIIVAGDWRFDYYEKSLSKGLERLGHEVIREPYVRTLNQSSLIDFKLRLAKDCERVEEPLHAAIAFYKPHAIFLNRPVRVRPVAIKRMQQAGARVLLYHNDNVYRSLRRQLTLRHFRSCLPVVDHVFCYRPSDLESVKARGAKSCSLFPPYYDPDLHVPPESIEPDYDAVYIGHFETDGRDKVMLDLMDRGISIFIGGAMKTWKFADPNLLSRAKEKIELHTGESYVKNLARGRVGLAFLSTLNQDVYTRRCFEMPACGVPALMPRTAELMKIFGKDTPCFFENTEELSALILHYRENEEERLSLLKHQRRVAVPAYSALGAAERVVECYRGLVATGHD